MLLSANYSMSFGQPAPTLGVGNLELGVATGIEYTSDSFTVNGPPKITNTVSSLVLPVFEANMGYGLADNLDLNLHASLSGVQGGVKVGLSKGGSLDFSILPQVGFVYVSEGNKESNDATNTTVSTSSSALGILLGFKLIASMPTGLYFGAGYDFQHGQTSAGGANPATFNAHNLLLAGGYSLTQGKFQIRPELALLFAPARSTSVEVNGVTFSSDGGTGFALFPNVTIAMRP
jgi:hypothetical protein